MLLFQQVMAKDMSLKTVNYEDKILREHILPAFWKSHTDFMVLIDRATNELHFDIIVWDQNPCDQL